ncbi:DUF5057 domain-containing protein [Patescibacteria group bacterium]|nr:DUF5057 domain-containing protein [Patescibacteria group bacterium]
MISRKNIKNLIFLGLLTFLAGIFWFNLQTDLVHADQAGLVKEFLFTVQGSSGDAIGVKIMENPQRLTPSAWYQQNVQNPGNPSIFMVDGYYALREGRTVYVGATNVSGVSNENISSYIYIISYNEGASAETVNIFNQLLEKFTFNTNLTNADQRGEIQRDLFRIYDLDQISSELESYYGQHGSYPPISSGSYLKGETYSAWPSWQYTFGQALGKSLPVDPLNRFYGSCAGCPDNPQQSNYQCDGTCYNPLNKEFAHPNNSHVYGYYTPTENDCSGQGYELSANFEYYPFSATPPLPAVRWLGDNEIQISLPDILGKNNYIVSQGLGECGDQVLNACEECEIIDSNMVPSGKTCASLGLGSGSLSCVDCHWDGCGKLSNGENCSLDVECSSGYCSPDGVCCNTACQGLCQSCNQSGQEGTCLLVPSGEDPGDVCSDTAPCLTGNCDGLGACELESSGTSCGDCQYCSVNGQCLPVPFGEDYNNQCSEDSSNCEAGYCDGYGSCTYYPAGFICGDCRYCSSAYPPDCNVVPGGTNWGFNYYCDNNGNFACYVNWGNCDGDWNTGCGTNLLLDPENCGECDNSCSDNQTCQSGECVCLPGYADCNGDPSDGCEASLNSTDHCGYCGNDCPSGYDCLNGSCSRPGSCGDGIVQPDFEDCDPNEDPILSWSPGLGQHCNDVCEIVIDLNILQNYPGTTNDIDLPSIVNEYKNDSEFQLAMRDVVVTSQSLSYFNDDPDFFIPSGNRLEYYNVLVFGWKDCNGSEDLSPEAAAAVDDFIDQGGSVIFGHDTIWQEANSVCGGTHTNFNTLKHHAGIGELNNFSGVDLFNNVGANFNLAGGKLFTIPYVLEEEFDVLSTHLSGQVLDPDTCEAPEGLKVWYYAKIDGSLDYNKPWANTCGKVEMIQLGHITGEPEDMEKKALINMLYYVATAGTDVANNPSGGGGALGTGIFGDSCESDDDCSGDLNLICGLDDTCACGDDWGNCNGNPDDGCETNLLTTWLHCGACTNQCDPDEDCVDGTCEGGGGGNQW